MPLALGLYYLVPGRVKNAVLLVESLLFFCWGGITWLPLAVGMVAINYAAGLLLASLPAGGKRKIVLIAAIVLTAAALVYCKYTNFLLDTLNVIASTGFAKLSFWMFCHWASAIIRLSSSVILRMCIPAR